MSSSALVYAVRGGIVWKYLGELCLPLSLALLVPLGLAVWSGSWTVVATLAGTALATGTVGVLASRAPDVEDLQTNESMVVVALAFILAATVMVPPFMAWGLTPSDAFFEAVSAITTTGLSTLPEGSHPGADFLLTRNWLQWFGGLGFVTLSVLLISRRGPVSKRLQAEEGRSEGLAAHTRTHGRRALRIYAGLTVAGAVLLLLTGLPVGQAVGFALSSVSTGGFSPPGADLSAASLPSTGLLVVLFTLGAVPLVTLHRALQGDLGEVRRDPQLLALLALGLLAAGLLVLFTPGEGPWFARSGRALFLAFSAHTTTGFSLSDPGTLPAAAQAVLLVAMFVGGSAGSTAGGVKLWRALVVLRLARHDVVDTALPQHAVHEPELAGESLDQPLREAILVLVILFAAVVGLSWLAFLAAGHPPLPSLFDVVSATATVGLSAGVTGPELSAPLKWVLSLDMLMGRLEILAVLVLLAPRSWIGRRRSQT